MLEMLSEVFEGLSCLFFAESLGELLFNTLETGAAVCWDLKSDGPLDGNPLSLGSPNRWRISEGQ